MNRLNLPLLDVQNLVSAVTIKPLIGGHQRNERLGQFQRDGTKGNNTLQDSHNVATNPTVESRTKAHPAVKSSTDDAVHGSSGAGKNSGSPAKKRKTIRFAD